MSSPFTQSLHGFKRFWFPPPGEPNIEDVLVARVAIVLRVGAFLLLPAAPPLWLLWSLHQGAVFNNFWLLMLIASPALCFPIGWALMYGRVSLRSCLLWIAVFSAYWSTTFPLALKNRVMYGRYQAIQIIMGNMVSPYQTNEFAIQLFEKLPDEIHIGTAKDRSAVPLFKLAKFVRVRSINYCLPWFERTEEEWQSLSELDGVPQLLIELCNTCKGEVQRASSAIAKMTGLKRLTVVFVTLDQPNFRAVMTVNTEKRVVHESGVCEGGFDEVFQLPSLKILALHNSCAARQYLEKMHHNSAVEEVQISGGVWQPRDFRALRNLSNLRRLSITGNYSLTDEHLAEISTLSKTRKLQFKANNLPEQFIADNPQIDFSHFVVGDGG